MSRLSETTVEKRQNQPQPGDQGTISMIHPIEIVFPHNMMR